MPYYYKLRIRDNDSDQVKADKRRVASKLLELRKAIAEHIRNGTHGTTDHDEDDHEHADDRIAYWIDPQGKGFASKSVTKIEVHRAGVFYIFATVFRAGADDPNKEDETHYQGLDVFKAGWKYKDWRTFQMSDHLRMWIELRIDFADEYLEQIRDSP